ncbi:SHOCT-like domain-containing protein [Halanaerobaculum tunisiense]
MEQEKKKILKMLEQDQLTAEEAMKLLSNIEEVSQPQKVEETHVNKTNHLWIKIWDSEELRFNFNIPLDLAKLSSSLLAEDIIAQLRRDYDIDLREIISSMKDNIENKRLVDYYDQQSDTKVEIYIA